MKLYLASYFQPENHGPGRLVGISYGKPKDSDAPFTYQQFAPNSKIWFDYKKLAETDRDKAGIAFEKGYKQQITSFISQLRKDASEQNKKPTELLPFQDGDTLASWENEGNLTYRNLLAPFLLELGYEVIVK